MIGVTEWATLAILKQLWILLLETVYKHVESFPVIGGKIAKNERS